MKAKVDNYICNKGKKTEITAGQIKTRGLTHQLSLAEICGIVKSGKAREHFNLHDTINAGGYTLEVIGFDHDTTLGRRHVADREDHTMTVMAKELLPAHRMHSGACERGWIDTELRKWLNEAYIEQLPEELVRHIAPVFKLTHGSDGEVYETCDKLFLPSESELFGSAIWSDYEDGPRYEAFATSIDRVRVDEDGARCLYWSRSFLSGHSAYCTYVYTNGNTHVILASTAGLRAPLCFCLA